MVEPEEYTPERRAEFILNCDSVDPEDYAIAREIVIDMGIDPDTIPHNRPPKHERKS